MNVCTLVALDAPAPTPRSLSVLPASRCWAKTSRRCPSRGRAAPWSPAAPTPCAATPCEARPRSRAASSSHPLRGSTLPRRYGGLLLAALGLSLALGDELRLAFALAVFLILDRKVGHLAKAGSRAGSVQGRRPCLHPSQPGLLGPAPLLTAGLPRCRPRTKSSCCWRGGARSMKSISSAHASCCPTYTEARRCLQLPAVQTFVPKCLAKHVLTPVHHQRAAAAARRSRHRRWHTAASSGWTAWTGWPARRTRRAQPISAAPRVSW